MIAIAVTITDALLAFPIAYYMARMASPRTRGLLVVADPDAALGVVPRQGLRLADHPPGQRPRRVGASARSASRTRASTSSSTAWLVFSYLWLPYMILPIYAGLERIPRSLLEASSDLGGRPGTTFRRVVLPLVFPALVAGSIFTFSLTLGDYITPDLVSDAKFIGNVIYDNSSLGQPAARRGLLAAPDRDHDRLPARRAAPRRLRVAVRRRPMTESAAYPDRAPRWRRSASWRSCTCPLIILAIYAFNTEPHPGVAADRLHAPLVRRGAATTRRSGRRSSTRSSWQRSPPRSRWSSGTLAALAVQRYSFFGRETISFLLVLPIALPGVVTGIALRTSVRDLRRRLRAADDRRRPCDVLRRHRLQQRHRPAAPPAPVARGGVGRPRRRHVHELPADHPARAWERHSCPAALLAFALSFDEIIVTNFTAGAGDADAPDLDLHRDPAPERAAGRQRRRPVPDAGIRRSRSTSRRGSAANRRSSRQAAPCLGYGHQRCPACAASTATASASRLTSVRKRKPLRTDMCDLRPAVPAARHM